MAWLTGNSKYVDIMEKVIYNNVLAGISLEGDQFFYVNLFIDSDVELNAKDTPVALSMRTAYPRTSKIELSSNYNMDSEISMHIRIPEWCTSYRLKVNGNTVHPVISNGYLEIKLSGDDNIELDFDMPVRLVKSNINNYSKSWTADTLRNVQCAMESNDGSNGLGCRM